MTRSVRVGQEEQNTESLYDVLYVDNERLLNYSAQLDPNGHLTSIKLTKSNQASDESAGQISVHVAKGTFASRNSHSDGFEHSFDPSKVIPFDVLNQLDERGLILRTLSEASHGSLVLCSGGLRIKDLSSAQIVWPIIEKTLPLDNIFRDFLSNQTNPKKITHADMRTLVRGLFNSIEHPLHGEILTESKILWATLNSKYLIPSAIDLMLKYTTTIPGRWYILCAVDCLPEGLHENYEEDWDSVDESFTSLIDRLARTFSRSFGRPAEAYGVTPLIIFREIPHRP